MCFPFARVFALLHGAQIVCDLLSSFLYLVFCSVSDHAITIPRFDWEIINFLHIELLLFIQETSDSFLYSSDFTIFYCYISNCTWKHFHQSDKNVFKFNWYRIDSMPIDHISEGSLASNSKNSFVAIKRPTFIASTTKNWIVLSIYCFFFCVKIGKNLTHFEWEPNYIISQSWSMNNRCT